MLFLIVKYAVTALVIVAVSEIAKRAEKAGALIAALPLVSIMIMVWLYAEKVETAKIAQHAYYTFWYVLPTLPMFLIMPWMLHRGFHFVVALGTSIVVTLVCFVLTAWLLKRFGIDLWP